MPTRLPTTADSPTMDSAAADSSEAQSPSSAGSSSGLGDSLPGLSGSDSGSGMASAVSSTASPTASTLPKWLGKRVGRFRLVSLLGRGSWGRVFEAEDTTLKRRVALKLLPTSKRAGMEGSDFGRVATEARAAASLEHPNVIQIFDIGEKDDYFYLAMELAEGGSVEDLMKTNSTLDAARACTICAEAGDALALAHECGITHRDVKPANLLLSRNGRCKVCDFGLAAGGNVSDPLHATRAAGTAHYVAPEVVHGGEADARSDIYSLGATLYHMLSGRRPFEGIEGRNEVLRAAVAKEPPALGSLRKDLDPKLAEFVAKLMSKDPGQRPASMRDVARGLRLFTVPVGASGPGNPEPPAATAAAMAMNGKGMIAVAGVALAVLIGVVAWAMSSGTESTGETSVVRSQAANTADRQEDGEDSSPETESRSGRFRRVAPTHLPRAMRGMATPQVADDEAEPDGAAAVESINADEQAAGEPVIHTFAFNLRTWTDRPKNLYVVGSFNDWSEESTPLTDPDGDRVYEATVELQPGTYHYKFLVDRDTPHERWFNDPAADPALDKSDGYGGVNSGIRIEAGDDDE